MEAEADLHILEDRRTLNRHLIQSPLVVFLVKLSVKLQLVLVQFMLEENWQVELEKELVEE